jgi:hypothetical protein
MAVSERQLFLDLEALSEDQIEVGLDAGVWGDPARPMVQRYLDQMKLRRIEAAASAQLDEAREALIAVREAVEEARGSNLRATAALIIAGGAIVAAMAAAFIAFMALGHWTISW